MIMLGLVCIIIEGRHHVLQTLSLLSLLIDFAFILQQVTKQLLNCLFAFVNLVIGINFELVQILFVMLDVLKHEDVVGL